MVVIPYPPVIAESFLRKQETFNAPPFQDPC